MAWWNATPRPEDGTPRAERAAKAGRKFVSRAEDMKAKGVTPQMPPCPLPHIVHWLIELGLTEAAGMGVVPLSWVTLAAWQAQTGVMLSPWEARLLRHLSTEYLAEGRRAEVEGCPAPWRAVVTKDERAAEEAALRAVLG